MNDRESHRNDERTVKCPVEGCEEEVLARGIHLHVRQSADDGHGPQGEVPDCVSFDDLETVGTESVEMEYPTERDSEQVARLCPYCSEVFTGKEGVRIHLGQTAGRKNHPPNANELHEPEDFPQVTVDDQDNVTGVLSIWADDGQDLPTGPRVPATRVYRYIAQLMADDKYEDARQARQMLLGASEDEVQ